MNEQLEKNLEETDIWFIRGLPRQPESTNIDCLEMTNDSRTLYATIRCRQTSFCGHEMRREALEYTVTAGKINARRDRSRPREIMLDGLRRWYRGISTS